MLLTTGTLVRVTFAYENMGSYYRPIVADGMYLRTLPDGREDILLPDLWLTQVAPFRVSIRCSIENPAYPIARAELFPDLAPGAEYEIGESTPVQVPVTGDAPQAA